MEFSIGKSVEILQKTPLVLEYMLQDLSEEWVINNEGIDTWSPFDIVDHLIHGEKTDWVPRMEIILSDNPNKEFQPFDRFAQFENSRGKTLQQLLNEFRELRKGNIENLLSKNLSEEDLQLKGIHPAFGDVTLRQLLATWVAHDLGHIAQVARVMAKQYKTEVGPWKEYLRIVNE